MSKPLPISVMEAHLAHAKCEWAMHGANFYRHPWKLTDTGIFAPTDPGGAYAFSVINDDVRIVSLNIYWRQWNAGQIWIIMLHEVGHLIRPNYQHSPDPNDIMYSVLDEKRHILTSNDVKGWG